MLGDTEEVHEYGEVAYARPWYAGLRRMSWGAVFAGLFVTLAIFLTLQILGAGIGLSTVSLTGGEVSSGKALGTGAAIWTSIVGLISLFIGGWVAGRLASQPGRIERVLHGLTMWGFFYVVMFWVVTTALGVLAGGGLALLGKGVSAAGQAATTPQGQQAMASQGLTAEAIAGAVGISTAPQGQQGAKDVAAAVHDYLKGPRTPQDRQQLAQVIAQDTGKSPAEADQMIGNLERTAQQAKQTTEQAANITGATFIGLAISMFLGAIVAMLGSLAAGAPQPVHPREYTHVTGAKTETGTYASR
jgi:hypothetical protein